MKGLINKTKHNRMDEEIQKKKIKDETTNADSDLAHKRQI